MHHVTLFGAGKIGEAVCGLLALSGRYQVRLCDNDLDRATKVAAMWPNCEARQLKLAEPKACDDAVRGTSAVLSALPFHCNVQVAEIALRNSIHYLDLTEDVNTTKAVSKVGEKASRCFLPQCGLAPGFISIAAAYLIAGFDSVDTVKMRVGALPIYPSNRLKYNLTWSTEGVINQYGNMCELIDEGVKRLSPALEGYERFSLDGVEYEAFNTSGGLGSLCDSLEGKVRRLDYKSVRYPGHRDLVAFLMQDLRFNEDRETLRKVFERSLSFTAQDKCLVFIEARGTVKGRLIQKTYASTVYNTVLQGRHFGAIQLTTASGICAPLDLLMEGKLPRSKGVVRSEEINLLDFLNNEFGKYYRDEHALQGISI